MTLGAPRLYEKMYAAVLQSASEAGGLKKAIVFWARRVAIEYAEAEVGGGGASALAPAASAASRIGSCSRRSASAWAATSASSSPAARRSRL